MLFFAGACRLTPFYGPEDGYASYLPGPKAFQTRAIIAATDVAGTGNRSPRNNGEPGSADGSDGLRLIIDGGFARYGFGVTGGRAPGALLPPFSAEASSA